MPNLPDATDRKSQAQHEATQPEAPQHHESSETVTLSQSDAEQRLRQAAHILANGAIRAALKQRTQQAGRQLAKTQKPQPKTPPRDVLNTDIVSQTEATGEESHLSTTLPTTFDTTLNAATTP